MLSICVSIGKSTGYVEKPDENRLEWIVVKVQILGLKFPAVLIKTGQSRILIDGKFLKVLALSLMQIFL